MSIIEDALKKLQEKRSEGATGELPPPFPPSRGADLYAPRGGGRRVAVYAVFLIASAAVAGGVWLGLDMYQESLQERTRAAAPVMPLEKAPSAPEESAQEQAGPAAAPDEQEQTASETASVQREARETPSGTETAVARQPEAVMEPWIERGRRLMNEQGMSAALPVWEEGLRSLDSGRLVLIPSVYEREEDAESALDMTGEESSAFAARGWYNGKEAYYLLSAPPEDMIEDEQKRLMESLSMPSVKGASAGKLIARMREAPKPAPERVEQVVAAPKETAPAPEKPSEPAAPERENVKEAKEKPAAFPAVEKEEERKREASRIIAEKYARARRMLMEGRYSAVAEEFQPEFVTPPARWEPYLIMGSAYLGMGLLDRAEEYLKQGIAVDGRQPQLWLQLAVAAQQRGNNSTALRLLREAEKLDPALPETQLNIGYSSDAMGDTDTAARAYRLFLSLTEGDPSYVEARGLVLKRLGELGY